MTLYYEDFEYEIDEKDLIEVLAGCIYRRGNQGGMFGNKKELDIDTIKFMIEIFDLNYDKDIIEDYIEEIKDYYHERLVEVKINHRI